MLQDPVYTHIGTTRSLSTNTRDLRCKISMIALRTRIELFQDYVSKVRGYMGINNFYYFTVKFNRKIKEIKEWMW